MAKGMVLNIDDDADLIDLVRYKSKEAHSQK